MRPAPNTTAWYLLTQSGYDLKPPAAAQNQGLEVLRDYLDDKGNAITDLKLGQEVTVRLRVRALGAKARGQIAIVDLLPGGFEAVLQQKAAPPEPTAEEGDYSEEEGDGEEAEWTPPTLPLALPGSTLNPEHIEVREDRVVLYVYTTDEVTEFRYRLRGNNAGSFVVPPVYAESMYDRSVYAQGGPAGRLQVASPTP